MTDTATDGSPGPEGTPPDGDGGALAHYAAQGIGLSGLSSLQRRLSGAPTLGALLARAVEEGTRACGFDRGVMLAVSEGRLAASGMEPVEDDESDELRRLSLGTAIPLVPGSEEAELIRRAEGMRPARTATQLLREPLGLRRYALAPVVPESRALALLVLDRADPPVTETDVASVELYAHLVAVAVERVVLRLRMGELSTEFRHLTASAHALIHEALEAPVALTTDFAHGQVFTAVGHSAALAGGLGDLLSDREREIASLMVRGRSNREIGAELHLSPDTIKAHVARLVRKLGAANRVEAVARYVAMTRDAAE